MMTRLGSPWHKVNETRPEDWCDNDFEADNSFELITPPTSDDEENDAEAASDIASDHEEERAKLAEIYGRSPSPK